MAFLTCVICQPSATTTSDDDPRRDQRQQLDSGVRDRSQPASHAVPVHIRQGLTCSLAMARGTIGVLLTGSAEVGEGSRADQKRRQCVTHIGVLSALPIRTSTSTSRNAVR